MELEILFREIELQEKMAERVMSVLPGLSGEEVETQLKCLMNRKTAPDALAHLTALFPDEDGVGILACSLLCACKAYGEYQKKGISDTVYFETMKCFTRFIDETQKRTGRLAFDRGWWTYRQISMQLFRIGELEYEFVEYEGRPALSIHIPSDAHFSKELVGESLFEARAFFGRHYPEYEDCQYICDSWLLSPELPKLLNAQSNILAFQDRFDIVRFEPDANDYLVWVFGVSSDTTDLAALKEETSMQKRIKQHVLNGGKIGIGFGVLK
ncbi:MAG: acyltransferase domain-containing protein [Oscillospiraceae bacterium]|nr:acyltransferase domain-containing protein [Oscillospiraceae bacterium]MDY3064419.1 acyltransferase domain-containing protein [Oscillospiraceae bacterium]